MKGAVGRLAGAGFGLAGLDEGGGKNAYFCQSLYRPYLWDFLQSLLSKLLYNLRANHQYLNISRSNLYMVMLYHPDTTIQTRIKSGITARQHIRRFRHEGFLDYPALVSTVVHDLSHVQSF